VNLDRVFMDVAVYNTRVMGKNHVEQVTNLACRTALSYRGVAHINFPVDLQEQESGERSKRARPGHTSDVWARRAALPSEADLRRAAEILNAGKKTVILAGRRALGAVDQLETLAETLAAPIVKPLLGKAAVPDDSPYPTGGVGLLGTRPSEEAIEGCDTLFMIGTSFPNIEFLPKPGQARGVQLDLDPHASACATRSRGPRGRHPGDTRAAPAAAAAQQEPQVPGEGAGGDRQSVAFVGDGAFSMLMAEFATCVKHELPVKVVVVKNNTLGQIKWEQMVFLGNPEYGCELHPIDFVAFARPAAAWASPWTTRRRAATRSTKPWPSPARRWSRPSWTPSRSRRCRRRSPWTRRRSSPSRWSRVSPRAATSSRRS
jgi:thiamine pyrophosphate-dependent acetolactate synthase large subunit-like protein